METVVPKSSHSHAAALVFDSPPLVLLLWKKKKKKRKKSVSVWVNTQRRNRILQFVYDLFYGTGPLRKIFAHNVDFTKNPLANLWLA